MLFQISYFKNQSKAGHMMTAVSHRKMDFCRMVFFTSELTVAQGKEVEEQAVLT